MKRVKKYRILIEDESHLSTIAEAHLKKWSLFGIILAALVICISLAVAIIMFTPLRTFLPGYLNTSQRVATEENLLRLDSINDNYRTNQAYIDNCLRILNGKVTSDSVFEERMARDLMPDSLTGPSRREAEFVSQMEEKERFNISVLAPLAADGMIFSPVSPDGIFTTDSRTSQIGKVIVSHAGPVQSSADGSIVASYYSWTGRGYELVIQHDNGFMTAFSHVGVPQVSVGDIVSAGQVVALAPEPDRKGKREFSVRMWHDGLPVLPYDYVGNYPTADKDEEKYEAPRGR